MDISSEGIDKVFAMAIGIRQVLLTRAKILKMATNIPLCIALVYHFHCPIIHCNPVAARGAVRRAPTMPITRSHTAKDLSDGPARYLSAQTVRHTKPIRAKMPKNQ